MNARSGSLNFSPALNVRSKTACVSMLRILMRTSVCPPRAVGFETSTSRQLIRGAFVFEVGLPLDFDRFHHAGHARYCMRPRCRRSVRDRRARARCRTLSITLASGVPLGAFRCTPPGDRAAGAAGHEERHPLVVVQVGVAHRRSVDQQRAVEQRAVAVRRVLQLLQQVRHQADVIRVQRREVEDLLLLAAVVRRVVEGALEAALRIAAVRRVATQLEREDPRDVGRECQHLQIEHQLDVLAERVGHADRRRRQLAQLAAAVARLDDLDPPLDLAHVIEIVGEPRSIGRSQRLLPAARPTPAASRGCCDPPPAARARSACVVPTLSTPNSLSNTTRGSRIIGSGRSAAAQLIASV